MSVYCEVWAVAYRRAKERDLRHDNGEKMSVSCPFSDSCDFVHCRSMDKFDENLLRISRKDVIQNGALVFMAEVSSGQRPLIQGVPTKI